MSVFNSIELISTAKLSATSTNPNGSDCYGGSCDINQVKQIAANDQNNHLTNWQSALDPSCADQSVSADWYSASGYQTISSYSVLNGVKGVKGGPKQVVLHTKDGDRDITSYRLCTSASVNDGGVQVEWDICALSSTAPSGIYDYATGITFTFTPPKWDKGCQMGLYELQVHGNTTPGSDKGLSVGAIIGIVIAALLVGAIGAICVVRQRNLAKRERTRRFTGEGNEWNGLLHE
ncbi:hypothetical protein HDU79_011544 [Rhizoclosmatium sp. JEL0117]|nr:hypothetical protein HDU79_011544 [Rhizoclosmatium sp. JEL0117]